MIAARTLTGMGTAVAVVHTNRATFFADSLLLFDAEPAANDTAQLETADRVVPQFKWIHCANEGLYKGHHQGEFDLTRATFESFVRNFHADPRFRAGSLELDGKTYTGGVNQVLQFDYEHASEMPPYEGTIPKEGAPACGWVLDVACRNGADGKAQLWVFGKLGATLRGQIQRDEQRFVSMAFTLEGVHWVTGKPIGPCLTSVAITNHPFMTDLEPLAAANRQTSVPLGVRVKPSGEPTEAPGDSTSLATGAPTMSEQAAALAAHTLFRERVCKSLGMVRVLADDAAVGDAVAEAAAGAGNLKSLLESLGVANPDDAMKVIPELRSARDKLAGMLGELDKLLNQEAIADQGVAKVDIGAAMTAQGFQGDGAEKAFGAYRTQLIDEESRKLFAAKAPPAPGRPVEPLTLSEIRDARQTGRERFLTEYGVKNIEHASLATTLVAGKGGVQLEPPAVPGKTLPISERGSEPAETVIDLRGLKGNTTQKLLAWLGKNEAGFGKLAFPEQIKRASTIKHSAQLTE